MYEVGECPYDWHADERDAEQDDVEQADAQDVGEPYSPAVHHLRVGVHLAVGRAHVHDARSLTRTQTLYPRTQVCTHLLAHSTALTLWDL